MAYYLGPTENFVSTTLNGSINNLVETITLNDASKLQAPGYIVIDREDGNGTATPTAREIVSYTGIEGNDLTGCTRGADSSTARSHSDGALVEATLTIGAFNSLVTATSASLNEGGAGLHVSNATISGTTQVATLAVSTYANMAGASVVGEITRAEGLKTSAKFGAYLGSLQTIPASTWTKVSLATEFYDPGSSFDANTNYQFVSPATGYYAVSGSVVFGSPVADKRYFVAINRDAAETPLHYISAHASHTGSVGAAISAIVKLNKDQTLQLYTYHDSSEAETIAAGTAFTYLFAHFLSEV